MIEINLYNNSILSIDCDSIQNLSNLVLNDHGYLSGKINIIITDDESLREMKLEFFNEDVFTDVIAFNLEQDPFEGEIYISSDRVEDNAKIYKQRFEDELKRVIIHGLLHLCGHKDSTTSEKENMNLLEDKFLSQFIHSVIEI
jgi:rRNA maturation RNase YbeY